MIYNAQYIEIYNVAMKNEGGYTFDVNDSGNGVLGTYKGIAHQYNPTWKGFEKIAALRASGKTNREINDMLKVDLWMEESVKEFYYNKYYQNHGYDFLPFDIALVLTDSTILFGANRVRKNMQKIINNYGENLVVDGIFGSQSKAALDRVLQKISPREFALAYLLERVDDIMESVAYKSSNEKYLKGWLNRVLALYNYINKRRG